MWNKYTRLIFYFTFILSVQGQDSSFTFKNNDYLKIGNFESLRPSEAITVEAWILPEFELPRIPELSSVVHYLKLAAADDESGFSLMYVLDTLRFVLSVGDAAGDTYGDGLNLWPGIAKTDFSDEEWTHVAGTYDKNTRTAKIYKNGIEQDSFTIPEGTCGSCRLFWDDIADVELKIGYGDNMPNQNYFNGSIDDVRIWDIALDQNIIENNVCTPPDISGNLLGYWNFNDGNDETINDLSGNSNDGTLMNDGEGYWDGDVYENENVCESTRACVDSVITDLPFFHSNTLDDTMGDDWNFEDDSYNDNADFAYELMQGMSLWSLTTLCIWLWKTVV